MGEEVSYLDLIWKGFSGNRMDICGFGNVTWSRGSSHVKEEIPGFAISVPSDEFCFLCP